MSVPGVDQRLERRCLAAIRALSGQPDVQRRGGRLYRNGHPVPMRAPHLHPDREDDIGSFRGASDGIALRLLHSDPRLHERTSPAEDGIAARLVFEILEQFRCEALVPETMPGAAANLAHRHEQWSLAYLRSGLAETARGLLLYTVAQVGRARVTGRPVLAATEDLIESTRAALTGAAGPHLAALRKNRHDQAAFAEPARAVAQAVAAMLSHREGAQQPREARTTDRQGFSLLVGFDSDGADSAPGDRPTGAAAPAGHGGYRVFTTAYDREQPIAELVRPALLTDYRERLDRRIARRGLNPARLARELRALLAEPVQDGWDTGREDGRLDGRRLAQLVASPGDGRVFRSERTTAATSTLVTFLVDCSGSMKRQAGEIAVLVDIYARALEQAGAACEVLGFTTGAWNGGRVREAWLRAGRPAEPGRLNERRHLILKAATTPWRRARRGLAGLLKEDLFREGLDGEAVQWAGVRMSERPEQRRLLVVVSDGSPSDSATDLANGPGYLPAHLDAALRCVEASGVVACGLGVGADLSRHYRRWHELDLSDGCRNRTLRETLSLIARSCP